MKIPVALLILLSATLTLDAQTPDGHSTIRGGAGPSDIVITTTPRVAGAIDSLKWNGREFINSFDHGRQLQSALNLDGPSETCNPTEAGSRRDGAGGQTTSRLLHLRASADTLQTITQMAFWIAPGEKSGPNPARNTTTLSNFILTKTVRIGYRHLPHVISYQSIFTLPPGESHHSATFEALTGYMPPDFDQFFQFNPARGDLEPLPHTQAEIPCPLVFSVPGGSHAIGIYAPPQPMPATTGPTYGRWFFDAEKVAKWNCVFRTRNPDGIAPGSYPFTMFVIVGDIPTVRDSMRELWRENNEAN